MQVSPKLGNYVVNLGNAQLEKSIAEVWYRQTLDAYATFTVVLAADAPTMRRWKTSDCPAEASLTWAAKKIFAGHILKAEIWGVSRIHLTYVDGLYLASKESGNSFMKQQTLRDALQKLAAGCGLQPQFRGTFAELLTGFQHGSSSSLEVIQMLADKHGFHFTSRSGSSHLLFIKSGEGFGSASVDVASDGAQVSFRQSAETSYDTIQFRYFDSKTAQPADTKLMKGQLYQPLSGFTAASSFQEKTKWKTACGKIETYMTDRHHFDGGQRLLAEQLSKRAMAQEALQVVCFEPLALPGDKLSATNCPSTSQDGAYLVSGCEITINSALPRLTLTAMRA